MICLAERLAFKSSDTTIFQSRGTSYSFMMLAGWGSSMKPLCESQPADTMQRHAYLPELGLGAMYVQLQLYSTYVF